MNKVYLGQVGLPSEAVSIILSVDWLLDRLPTFSTSTIIYHLDHFNRTLSLSFESTTLAWRMQALSLTTLFIISPADQVVQISIFSLARFRTAINVLGDSIGAGIVNHLSKVIFFLVKLYDICCPFCLAQRGRISKVRRKLGGTVSSSKKNLRILSILLERPASKVSTLLVLFNALIAHHHFRRNCCG